MAKADNAPDLDEDWMDDSEPEMDEELEEIEDLDDLGEGEDDDGDAAADDDGDDDGDDEEEGGAEALDKLEAEELEMLTEDEAAEALPVDEAEELRQLRREAIALEAGAEDQQDDEFVCASCFLVKRTSQLANRRKKLCKDCV